MSRDVADPLLTAPEPPPPPAGLQPRTVLLLVSLFASVLLVAVAALLPVPYVVLSAGPALNTLSAPGGKQLIEISGRQTYPTSGGLYLTTVSVAGGPHPVSPIPLLTVLRAWLDPHQAVVPQEYVYPPDQTAEQADQQNREEMTGSQTSATAAALGELAIPFQVTVGGVGKDVPSAAQLAAGDVLLAVDGHPVTGYTALRQALAGVTPGAQVQVRLRRAGDVRTVPVTTTKAPDGRAILGIAPDFAFPFPVKIQIDDIGGPSAGTMFALGIIDKLTPGDLTGGKHIAGTGEIGPDGTVGADRRHRGRRCSGRRAAGATLVPRSSRQLRRGASGTCPTACAWCGSRPCTSARRGRRGDRRRGGDRAAATCRRDC